MIYKGPIEAPVKKDQIIGKLKVVYDQDLVGEFDLFGFKRCKKGKYF